MPSGLAGQYYIFIRADRNNQLAESNENNNVEHSETRFFAACSAFRFDCDKCYVQPPTASPGESATFNWTVQNIGANPATGLWTDTVYLSTDQTWDIGDVLVGRYTAGVNVAPGQTYNGTLSTALPAVNLGNYYVIVRTDIRNRLIETNENNNSGASGGTTTVDVPELQLGVSQSTTLVTGQERFYKFNAPANETVRVSLDGQDGSSNELYTRFGQMASRNAYDFLFDRLYEPDQQLLIPNTNAGNYYNMIRGENVPNSLANNEVKPAGKLNTKPIDSKQTTAAENVTVKAEIIPFSITSVSPNRIGDNGQVTITLKGAKFAEGATVKLVQGNNVLNAAKIIFVDAATVKARFFFTNASHGVYDVKLINPNSVSTLSPQAVVIETATPMHSEINESADMFPIIGRVFNGYGTVKNTSNVDIPYLQVAVILDQVLMLEVNTPARALTFPSEVGSKSKTFIIRDFAPDEQESFSFRVRGYRPSFEFFLKSTDNSSNEFLLTLMTQAEIARQLSLDYPELEVPAPFISALTNQNAWWNIFRGNYIQAGLIDETTSIANFDKSVVFLQAKKALENIASSNVQGCINLCSVAKLRFIYLATRAYWACVGSTLGTGFLACSLAYLDAILGIEFVYQICVCACSKDEPPLCGNIPQVVCSFIRARACPRAPSDPNDKQGPSGYGPQAQIGIQQPLSYTINFENVPTATASAQRVRVTDQLDPNVDPRTFRLKEIGFGSYRLQVPENRAFFGQRVQLGAEFNNILADISAGVDISTGRVTWTLTAIDPATGEQPNSANLGLLAPNDETGRGQGFVTYTVQPKQNAPTGTVIRNNATIIFDTEEPITTNTVTNTLDADIPTSAVNALPPTQSTTTFTVSWTGTDLPNGSGLQNYDVWVAEGDGAYQPFVSGTTDLSAEFTGTLGKTYRFYSIARDNAGNVEAAPNAPDATTRILSPTAANVTVGGRVSDSSGGGISRARITMTAPNGTTRTVTTNTFGFYHFDEVPAGGTYIFNIQHSRYRFEPATRIVSVIDEVQDVDFQAISK